MLTPLGGGGADQKEQDPLSSSGADPATGPACHAKEGLVAFPCLWEEV